MTGVDGTALEREIEARIGDERHRWLAIEFRCRGETGPHYQILDVHHNLTRLDADTMAVVDDIIEGWELVVQEEMKAGAGFGFQTLTYDSENPREHRHLAETILHRVYGTTLANVDRLEQVDGEPDSSRNR